MNDHEQDAFCKNCKRPFGGGNFCVNCGVPVMPEPGDVPPAPRQVSRKYVEGKRRQIVKLKRWRLFKVWFDANRKLAVALSITAGLGVAYLMVQVGLFVGFGPQLQIAEYQKALKVGNFAALDDHSLFPGGDSSKVPDYLKTSFVPDEMSSLSVESVSRRWLTASADLASQDTVSTQIDLEAKLVWHWGFQIPEWDVVTPAPTVTLAVNDNIANEQNIVFGDSASGEAQNVLVGDLRSSFVESIGTLPGIYAISMSPFGFVGMEDISLNALENSQATLEISLPEAVVSPAIDGPAVAAANGVAAWCASVACGSLGSNGEYDFDLWSQYPRDTYTESSFDVSFSPGVCTQLSSTYQSATQITVNYSCPVTANAHLYVKYVYFQGFYSSYWYYWDFYDTAVRTMFVTVVVTTDPSGAGVNVISAG